MDYFQDATTQRFTFTSFASGVSETTFAVLRFKGMEAISTPYEFEIMLVSGDPDLDMSAILQSQAVFTICRDSGDDVAYNGILAEFDQLHAYNEHYFYRAKLVPKIWWLMQTQHNQVFLDKTVPEIIEGALVDGGMDSLDYDLSALEGTYNPVDYVCQYGESHFNFVSRWLEREGVYYYFYHDIDGDRLVLSDSSFSHEPFQQGADLVYSPKTGMEQGHLDEIIINFTCRQKQLPNRIVLKDHNPERPSLEMAVHADVDPDGRGETFLYGEHYSTPEEGERLITFRAEELLCTKQAFHGDSTVPFLTPGFKFNLGQHYRSAFNQEYMVTSVTHEGDQTNLLKTSVIGSLTEDAEINIYSNSFTAIPADRQYRHPRTADRPRISGTLHGKIDGEQDSPYAQLDEQGRYKVKLPFDINDEHIDGKASARVRMMQPYAGEGKGMQFPLTKGTEVLLTFIDGNPDRPVIAGAVSTDTAPSPVNADNQSESVIRSAGNNRIRMEDKAGSERMVLQTPKSNSWIRAGAPNDPPSLNVTSPQLHQEGSAWTDPKATYTTKDDDGNVIDTFEVECLWLRKESEVNDPGPVEDFKDAVDIPTGKYIARYKNSATDETSDLSVWSLDIHDKEHEFLRQRSQGIMLHTDGSFWLEAGNRYAEYTKNYPQDRVPAIRPDPQIVPATLNQLLFKFVGDGSTDPDYNPTGMLDYLDTTTKYTDFKADVLSEANVRLSSFDTVNTQEGNIYDFGGYWNYNLGNSYEEAHIDQSPQLNRPGTFDSSKKINKDTKEIPYVDKVFGDILSEGGPNWEKVDWTAMGEMSGVDLKIPNMKGSTTWESGSVWTTKEFGDSYDLRNGSAISITNGSSLDISYTGHTQVELKMRSHGDPASYTHSSGGVTTEKKWASNKKLVYDGFTKVHDGGVDSVTSEFDRNTGDLYKYNANSTTGMGTAEFEFDYSNKASTKITTGSSFSFESEASASIAISLAATLKMHLDVSVLTLDLKAPFSGIAISSTLGGGGTIDIGSFSVVMDAPGPDIKVKAAGPKIETGSLWMGLKKLEMKSGALSMSQNALLMMC